MIGAIIERKVYFYSIAEPYPGPEIGKSGARPEKSNLTGEYGHGIIV